MKTISPSNTVPALLTVCHLYIRGAQKKQIERKKDVLGKRHTHRCMHRLNMYAGCIRGIWPRNGQDIRELGLLNYLLVLGLVIILVLYIVCGFVTLFLRTYPTKRQSLGKKWLLQVTWRSYGFNISYLARYYISSFPSPSKHNFSKHLYKTSSLIQDIIH